MEYSNIKEQIMSDNISVSVIFSATCFIHLFIEDQDCDFSFTKMKCLLYLLVIALGASAVPKSPRADAGDQDWWKHAVFYQIYPRSFKDSDGDGIGDLQGIISKLDHLKDAGITATWLSPIYKSPQVDQGYDISDFRDIAEEYGTLDDFKQLVEKAHDQGIKIIMDFVPNHSSDMHDWFQRSEAGEQPYSDFYVWKDAVDSGPPNNWVSSI